jgi:YrbI family 3-deoxy-D-manno-octulosonate 8-phosphate phosphatase
MVSGRPEVLALVLARGGSKGIPRKNIREFAGHPLVAYSIAAGLEAESVTRLIVSTDDPEIAEVACRCGAEVPFTRPVAFATDDAPDLTAVQHALEWLEINQSYRPEIVVQLRPTSPLRPPGLIDAAVVKLRATPQAECVRGVTAAKQTPYKMWRTQANGLLEPLLSGEFHESYNMPRQQLPTIYWQTGHVDAFRYETIAAKKSLSGDHIAPLLIEPSYCVDLDTEADWLHAEWLVSQGNLTFVTPKSIAPSAFRLPAGRFLVVLDFDGVLTDNRVFISETGAESVVCDRSDGQGLALLRTRDVEVVVLSAEVNPVVAARCHKLQVEYRQGERNKQECLRELAAARGLELSQIIYVGNDLNDRDCLNSAGYSVAVADAHAVIRQEADLVLTKSGGKGAVRELCELIIAALDARESTDGKRA